MDGLLEEACRYLDDRVFRRTIKDASLKYLGIYPDGRGAEMGRGQDDERIVLPCKFGKLVCEVVRDDDEYKELAIDLYRNDGKVVQVCVAGTNENDAGHVFDRTCVHVDLWNGEDEDADSRHYTEPFGDGWWGEETI